MNHNRITRAIGRCASVVVAAVLTSACAAPPTAAGENTGGTSGRWWNDSEIVRDVIVGYLSIRADNNEVAADAAFGSEVIKLLLLFDAWGDQESLETLASLSSYYLGAHGGETYSCVVVRKGRAILSALENQAALAEGACAARFGDKRGVCAPEQSRASKLRTLMGRIKSGESCTVER